MKVVHAIPAWEWRKGYPGHGAWKDIMGRLSLWSAMGLDVEVVDVDVERPESLLCRLTAGSSDLVFEYTRWPELLRAARAKVPGLRIHVRAHNAEGLQQWHRRGETSSGAAPGLRHLWGTIRAVRADIGTKRVADTILGISAWDNDNYWSRLPGRARVVEAPYFSPWRELEKEGEPVEWSQRRSMVACMPGGRGVIECDMIASFARFASVAVRRPSGMALEFGVTNAVETDGPEGPLPAPLTALGDVGNPWSFLRTVRGVALLSELGFGTKTTVLDALDAGCRVIAAPAIARRLPAEARERCLVLRSLADREVDEVLDRMHDEPAPTNVNARLRERAREALRGVLEGWQAERSPSDSTPARLATR